MMTANETSFPAWPSTTRELTALALVAITGAVHVYVGIARDQTSLLVAGVGFFGAIGVFLLGHRRRLYLAGIAYVLLQIVLWLVFQAGEYTPIGIFDKAVQVTLVVVLFVLYRASG